MSTQFEKYKKWGFNQNPFPSTAPLVDIFRRAVFTGRESQLNDSLDYLRTVHSIFISGTYGMGKSFLLLECRARLKEENPEILPVYARALPKQEFSVTIRDALFSEVNKKYDILSKSTVEGRKFSELTRDENSEPFILVRELIGFLKIKGEYPVFLIDDIDRIVDVSAYKNIIDTTRELNALGCSVALPSNPNNSTKILLTVGHGIFEPPIVLPSLSEGDYKQMISRYLAAAKENLGAAPSVFINYAREDFNDAEKLYKNLRSSGYSPFLDKLSIRGGEKWQIAISNAIKEADFFIAILSNNSVNKRGYLQKELKDAIDRLTRFLERDIFLIPVRIDDCPFPEEISEYQVVDWRNNTDFLEIVKALKEGGNRRLNDPRQLKKFNFEDLNLYPFTHESMSYLLSRIGIEEITPRLLITACNTLLNIASKPEVTTEIIDVEFVKQNWNDIGGNILAGEASLDKLINLIRELVEKNGKISDDIDLESLKRLLDNSPGRFVDLIRRTEGFENIVSTQEKNGSISVELSPLITPEFVKETFLKMKIDDFRKKYGFDPASAISSEDSAYKNNIE